MNRKDTCPKMQMSKLMFNFNQAFYCLFISSNMSVAFKENNCCRELIFFQASNLQKKLSIVHSILPRKHSKFIGTWSLLSRVEAQDHLYVNVAAIFLLPAPVTRNRKGNIQIEKTKLKPLPSPATAPKILFGNEKCIEMIQAPEFRVHY